MATQIDSVSIEGMKHADFAQLKDMFRHVVDERIRWDREDYWRKRNERIEKWLNEVMEEIEGNKIKDKK